MNFDLYQVARAVCKTEKRIIAHSAENTSYPSEDVEETNPTPRRHSQPINIHEAALNKAENAHITSSTCVTIFPAKWRIKPCNPCGRHIGMKNFQNIEAL